LNKPKEFWAAVRSISEDVGYTERNTKQIKIPTPEDMAKTFIDLGLDPTSIRNGSGHTTYAGELHAYFQYRAYVLNTQVESNLMDSHAAQAQFQAMLHTYKPKCPIPMNKQKGKMKAPAYFTGIINMLIEANAQGYPCNYAPRQLTTFTNGAKPQRTLARWVDGAFPTPVNPIAVWEIKEYYYTTTFGSRVADGVYETLLDGMEIEEAAAALQIPILHYLMVDSHYTWWECGRSYLCRIIDLLHMGYVDEALFGKEVVDRLPIIVKDWVGRLNK
jgi:hypothetical protein